MERESFKVVYSSSPMEAEMFMNFLEEHGIPASLQNHAMGYIAPWYVSPGGHAPVDVIVPNSVEGEAKKVLAMFLHHA